MAATITAPNAITISCAFGTAATALRKAISALHGMPLTTAIVADLERLHVVCCDRAKEAKRPTPTIDTKPASPPAVVVTTIPTVVVATKQPDVVFTIPGTPAKGPATVVPTVVVTTAPVVAAQAVQPAAVVAPAVAKPAPAAKKPAAKKPAAVVVAADDKLTAMAELLGVRLVDLLAAADAAGVKLVG